MNTFEEGIREVIDATSQARRKEALKRVSRHFYWVCRHHGLEREDVLHLAAEIIGCFNEDIKSLKEKVEEEHGK